MMRICISVKKPVARTHCLEWRKAIPRILSINRRNSSVSPSETMDALCKQGKLAEAIRHFQNENPSTRNPSYYTPLLQLCVAKNDLKSGTSLHAHIVLTSVSRADLSVMTSLVNFYSKCGCLHVATQVFDEMQAKNVVSWTCMISAYSKNGESKMSLRLFTQMRNEGVHANEFTFTAVVKSCATLGFLDHGRQIHGEFIRNGFGFYEGNVFVGSCLIDMYVKCGNLRDARQVFDKMSTRNVVTWTSIVSGYAQEGLLDEALELYRQMPEKNSVTWTVMFQGCARVGLLDMAYELLGPLPDKNDVSLTAMIMGYAKNGKIHEALRIFKGFSEKTVFTWNTMISGCLQNGLVDEALRLFQEMPERNVVTWTTLVSGVAKNGDIHRALDLFDKMPTRNVASWNAMISGCVKHGFIEEAVGFFDNMPERDLVSWNAMISGYAQNGCFDEAVRLFQQMQLQPDCETLSAVLQACAGMAFLELGKALHAEVIRNTFSSDIYVENALVDLYGKCGSINDAFKVFVKMKERNVVSWTVMINGYGVHGFGKEAVKMFEEMLRLGIKPERITFISVLSACCHAGLVDDGWHYFCSMKDNHNIVPEMDHYCCMVDLFGRVGLLDDAYNFIRKMPIKPDVSVWASLLNACRIHGRMELGEISARRLLQLDSNNPASLVLLSNIHAAEGMWDDIEGIREFMKEKKHKKNAGCSWIELNKFLYTFCASDSQVLYGPHH